jgi:hypothetical protein
MDWCEDLGGGMIQRDRAVGVLGSGHVVAGSGMAIDCGLAALSKYSQLIGIRLMTCAAIPLPAARMLLRPEADPGGAPDDPSRHLGYTWTIRAPIPGGCAGPSPPPSKLGVVMTLECSP